MNLRKPIYYCPCCGNMVYIRNISKYKRRSLCCLKICNWNVLYKVRSPYDDGIPPGALPDGGYYNGKWINKMMKVAQVGREFGQRLSNLARDGKSTNVLYHHLDTNDKNLPVSPGI